MERKRRMAKLMRKLKRMALLLLVTKKSMRVKLLLHQTTRLINLLKIEKRKINQKIGPKRSNISPRKDKPCSTKPNQNLIRKSKKKLRRKH